jgi:site-specific DNA-methyltransferase (adenine-specific)
VHICITDPPYFIDGMGDDWDEEKITKRRANRGRNCTVGKMPSTMRFDPEQSRRLYEFMFPVCQQLFGTMVPGGFAIVFSQARLVHRMACALEDAGFWIRDQYQWQHDGQAKAASHERLVGGMGFEGEQLDAIVESLHGRKTPQLKPQSEPMTLAMKPIEGRWVENWVKWGTGFADVTQSLDGKFPGTLMRVPPPRGEERLGNTHMTIKPVPLIEHLAKLFSQRGQVLIDPFMGSGSHGEAALRSGLRFIGVERDPVHYKYANDRLRRLTS